MTKKHDVVCPHCQICQINQRVLILEIKNLKKKLSSALRVDPMTKLANKVRLYEEIDHSLSLLLREKIPKNHLSFIFVDIDGFKKLNDGNHLRGDNLIIAFASFLKAVTRESDTLARFGGDEFGILAQNTNKEEAQALCEKIERALKLFEFNYRGKKMSLSASFGAASTSEGFLTPLELIGEADARMQKLKLNKKMVKKTK